ncbi:Cadherin-like protein 3 [Leptotrombidium deliense]|uniref:Cadherin-like protein 3 n=1 Tax=Leptotrombidium deliense TaxID=299467 RepID=A0A443SRJ6_9ACAR|nr:Cadherin-like protein 3 [Leptotrombidium deliense]
MNHDEQHQHLREYGIQEYRIVVGNSDSAFRLVSHREKDSILYLDLQVNATLDRETVGNYTLIIEALDGGSPPLRGELTVNISVLDVNDNEPIFSQTTYYGSIAENATLGTSLLQVTATDADSGDNGLVTYSLHSRIPSGGGGHHHHSTGNSLTHFGINKNTGWIFVTRPLDFESKTIHELVVIAKDSGAQPLETSAFVSISVTDVNDNQPSISLLFLTESTKPEVPENAKIGDLVARISVNDPDSNNRDYASQSDSSSPNTLNAGFSVYLTGSEGHFGLTTQDSIVFLIVVTAPLNRQRKSKYTLTITASDHGEPPLNASTFFNLEVVDKNHFHNIKQQQQQLNVNEQKSSVFHSKVAEKSLTASTAKYVSAVTENSVASLFTNDPRSLFSKFNTQLQFENDNVFNLSTLMKKRKSNSAKNLNVDNNEYFVFEIEETAPVSSEIGSISVPFDISKDNSNSAAAMIRREDCLNGYFVDYLNEKELQIFGNQLPFLIESSDQSNLNIILSQTLDYEKRSEYKFNVNIDFAQCTLFVTLDDNYAKNSAVDGLVNNLTVFKIQVIVLDDPSDCRPFDAISKDVVENDVSMLEIEMPLSEDNLNDIPIDVYSLNDLTSIGCSKLKLSYKLSSPLVSASVLNELFVIDNNRRTLQLLPLNKKLAKDLLLQMELIVIIKAYLLFESHAFLASIAAKVKIIKDEERKINDVKFLNPSVLHFDEDCCLTEENIIQFKLNVSNDNLQIRYHFGEQQQLNDENTNGNHGNVDMNMIEDHFSLDADTGLLSLKKQFDFETREEFKINITAAVYARTVRGIGSSPETVKNIGKTTITTNNVVKLGSTAASSTTTASNRVAIKMISHLFTIKINNINDEIPKFAENVYTNHVLESLPPDSILMRLEAHDLDVASHLTYLIPCGHIAYRSFAVNPETGVLVTRTKLDRETQPIHRIPVYVFDDDYKHHDLTLIQIQLIDTNDNPPLFSNTNQVIKIPENIAVGTMFYTLVAYDKDLMAANSSSPTTNGGLRYRIVSDNQGKTQVFAIDQQNGHLSTVTQLDRERQDMYYLLVEVSDSRFNSTCNVTIEVLDINDNSPIFERNEYLAVIEENNLHTAVDTVNVIAVKANDADFKDKIYYTINGTETPEAMYFNIDSSTGLITTTTAALSLAKRAKRVFQQQQQQQQYLSSKNVTFTFNVYAVDIGIGSYVTHSSKTTVHITLISDAKAQTPRLLSYPLIVEIASKRESLRVGSQIGKVNFDAKTMDGELNVKIHVIAENPGQRFSDYFEIDSKTGIIFVKQTLAHNYYECYIQVQRLQGASSTTSLLQIFIAGDSYQSSSAAASALTSAAFDYKAGKKVKQFGYKVELYENVPQGTELINLLSKTRQEALDSRYRFEFAYTSVDQSYFHLNPTTGVISVRKVLDYETDPSFIELIVIAKKQRNSFDNPYIFNVSLSLLNINDNAPQFTQNHYVATVKEGENRGSFVAQISALDIDSVNNISLEKNSSKRRNTLTYHILEGNHDNAFVIDPPGSGIVRTNIVLDREIHDSYTLKIVASDEGAAFDARDGRSFGSNLHLTSYCTLEINVVDINDNVPVFPPYQEISVKEDADIGSVVSTLTANDVDTYPPLTYIKRKNGDDESDKLFDVGLYTGKITLKSSLIDFDRDSRRRSSYKLNIYTSDSLHSAETQVLVKIKRNENEYFASDSFFVDINPKEDNCISTSSALNCNLLKFSANEETKQIVSTKVCYELNSDHANADSDSFYVDKFRGILYNNKSLIASKSRLYQLSVSAFYCRDNGRIVSEEKARSSILVKVAAVSSNTVLNRNANVNVLKPLNNGKVIEVMRDKHGDTLLTLNSNCKYSIVDGNFGNVFALKRGNQLILVKKATRSEYKLIIKRIKVNNKSMRNYYLASDVIAAQDASTTSASDADNEEQVTIHIRVIGNEKEIISPAFRFKVFTVRIKESQSIGDEVIKVKADDYRNNNYRYAIFSGNELFAFRIDAKTGVIQVNNSLNFDRCNYYQLSVVAIDQNGSSDVGFAIINIIVTNVNNNSPRFPLSQYKAIVNENAAIGSKVVKIDAYDKDESTINYTLIRTIDGLAPFVYDLRTGYLITTEALDYESFKVDLPLYKLVLKAADFDEEHKTSSTEVLVEIQIASKDEFPPKFTVESYDFKVATGYGQSTVKVGQVSASDADLGPDGRIVYSLRSSSPATAIKKFTLNSTTGVITMNALSKDNIPPKYTSLIVSATSGRIDSLSSLAVVEVTIHIIDELKGVPYDENENFISSSSASNPLPTSLPGWTLFLIVFLMIITVVLLVSIIVIRLHQQQHQSMVSGLSSVHNIVPGVSTLLRKIGRNNTNVNPVSDSVYGQSSAANAPHHHHHHGVQYLVNPSTLPPCYSEVTTTTVVGEGHSASSGRGSAEDEVEEDMDEADEEIRMIIEGNDYYDQCDSAVPTTAEYLARLGVIDRHGDDDEDDDCDDDDDIEGELNIPIDDVHSDPGEMKMRAPKLFSSVRSQRPRQASEEWSKVDGSVTSIIHTQDELNGAYNWNYLQDWGPKYQPLSSVFAEIAKLKGGLNLSDGQSFDNNLNKLETASTISTSTAGSSHSHYRKNVSAISALNPAPHVRPRQSLLPTDLQRLSR